jgi:nitrite reductase/ring-hydroxylating ferredoxin subunit
VGLVHAAANVTATGLYIASLVQRSTGSKGGGKVLAYLGLATVSAGGFLGGHLSYRQAAGVNHSEEIPHRFPSGWHPLAPLTELPEGGLHKREVAGIPLLVHREGGTVNVLSDVCSHLSGPLHEGKIKDHDGDPCVVCPWHRSTFSLRTGEVKAGPATSRQPLFETRVTGELVEVRLPGADG